MKYPLKEPKPMRIVPKTWIDFSKLSEDVEKLEFPVPKNSQISEMDINSNQSEVFIKPLGDFNMLD